MAFQVKDALSITASLLNRVRATTRKITDFTVGAIARTLLESVALEIDELYQQMLNGLLEGIAVSTYNTFSFPALPAVAASGLLQVTISAQATPTLIAAGTRFTRIDNAAVYLSASDVTIAAGSTTASVQVAASVAGLASNVVANTGFTASPAPAGFVSASNAGAFLTGADPETEAARKTRFGEYVTNLERGTLSAVAYGASTAKIFDANGNITEQVVHVTVVEPYATDQTQPPALVNVYIHNGVGATSGALVTQAQTIEDGYYDAYGSPVPGWKAAGTHLVVSAATEIPVPITGVLSVLTGYDANSVSAAVSSAQYTYIQGLSNGATADLAQLYAIAENTPGVADFVISAPSADTTCTTAQKLMPGTITITPAAGTVLAAGVYTLDGSA